MSCELHKNKANLAIILEIIYKWLQGLLNFEFEILGNPLLFPTLLAHNKLPVFCFFAPIKLELGHEISYYNMYSVYVRIPYTRQS